MAKALMKSNTATCGDLAIEEGSSVAVGCLLEPIGRGIINTQNHQIQTMKGLLEFVGAKESNDCKIGGHEEMIPNDEKEMTPDDESSNTGECQDQLDVIFADGAVTRAWKAIGESMIAKEQRYKDPDSSHLILTFDFAELDSDLMEAYEENFMSIAAKKAVVAETIAMSCMAETRSAIDYEIRVKNFFQYTGKACGMQPQLNDAAMAFAVSVVESAQDGVVCTMRVNDEVESGAVSFSFGAAIAMSSIAPLVALF